MRIAKPAVANLAVANFAVAILSVATFAAAVAPLSAQGLPAPGTRIRVESSAIVGQLATGSLAEVNSGLITVAVGKTGASLVVPWSRTHSVNVALGRDARIGGQKGLLTGLGAALIVFPAFAMSTPEQKQTENRSALVPALIAGAFPIAGYVLGRRNGPERWEALMWRPALDTVLLEGEEPRLLITPGTTVRVRQQRRWFKGKVLASAGDSLRLQGSNALAWSDVSQVNMRDGRSRSRGASLGFVAMGAVTLVQLFSGDHAPGEKQRVIVTNLAIGTTVGALIGRPVWSRVPLPNR